jgi:hypothetical protein
MIANAKEVAEYQTFQTPLGKSADRFKTSPTAHILAKLLFPFVRTPINLLKYAGERTPLGVFSQEVRDNLAGKNGAVARDTQIARITLGTMVGVAALRMASQGLITGGGPADKSKKSSCRLMAGRTTASRLAICTIAIIGLIPSALSWALSPMLTRSHTRPAPTIPIKSTSRRWCSLPSARTS